jgi:adenosylcobinamide-GDP ribazoletransferase
MKSGMGLATALRTLTIFSVWGKECKSISTSLYWFVPVGLILGLLQWIFILLLYPIASPFLLASLTVAFQVYSTRAFHLDGLSDMVDGFGGGWTKERVLSIMKDSHAGAFGAISIGLLLIVKVAALTSLLERSPTSSVIAIASISRFLLVALATTQPYARKEGGTAGALINESHMRHLVVSFLQIVVISLLFFGDFLLQFTSLIATSIIVGSYIAYRGRKRIDGITGDLLGASCELSEALMLCVASFW